jgi:hypothetical protein
MTSRLRPRHEETFRVGSPGFANELVGGEPLESLEPAAEVIGGDEVGEMLAELVALVVERLTVASLMVRFIRSTRPFVHGCFALVVR